MKKSTIIWLIIIVIIVVFGIWYWSAGQSNSPATNVSTAASSSVTTAPAQIIVLGTSSTTQLGTFLVAMNGMTLYSYTKDTSGVSNCTGQCAVVWPPYTVSANEASSSLVGMDGANGQVGVITRADGSYQVTYNNTPLYFYSKDVNVGDTNGQGVEGTWFVVSP
jgi:predicted lipoprotein with Yx(FWY)xxD motif